VSAVGNASLLVDARAFADSEWTFSPLVDGVADFSIHGGPGIIPLPYSATLFDVTTNTQMWGGSLVGGFVNETESTFLDAEHVYAMHLTATAYSSGDFTNTSVHVSGIQAVPDNIDSFMCLCMGLLVALLGKWRLHT
jgi:hypothetical protein